MTAPRTSPLRPGALLEPAADLVHRYRRPLSALVLLIAVVLPLPAMLRFDGKTMEEGLILVGGELVLAGKRPHADFETLYGPADVWVAAAAFLVAGTSIAVERVLGLLYRLLLLWAVHRITRRWGWGVATGATALAWAIIAPFGLMAYSWIGAIAFGAASLALALDAGEHPRRWGVAGTSDASEHRWRNVATGASDAGEHRWRWPAAGASDAGEHRWRWLAAGAMAGVALLFRADLILGLALGLGPLLYGAGRASAKRFASGLSVGVVGYAAHFATAGPSAVLKGMFVDPVLRLRPGRRLPVPPSWSESAEFFAGLDPMQGQETLFGLDHAAQLAALFWTVLLAAAATVGLAWLGRSRSLLAFALFAAGILPQLLQRPSHNHVRFVAVLILPALAVALARRLRWRAVSGLGAVMVIVGLVALAPHHVGRAGYRAFLDRPEDIVVSHAGRTIPVDDRQEAADIELILAALDAVAAPGDRVFVGPERLARTNYSETYLYHLMPDYEPGSYHLQMNPGLANRQDGRLASDITEADWLILTDKFDGWTEPNSSVEDGDPRADAVVETSFCPIKTVAGRTLYGHC